MLGSIAILLVLSVTGIWSYPTYVPESVCESMIPGHGGSAQNSAAPYQIQLLQQIVKQGDIVQVVLSGSQPFQGFYLQGRTLDGVPVGTFIQNDIVKTHNCGDGRGNAAFHGVRGPKNNLEIFWKAPRGYQGQVIFTSTFVSEFDTFWTYVRANPLTVKNSRSQPNFHPQAIQARIMNSNPSDENFSTWQWSPEILNQSHRLHRQLNKSRLLQMPGNDLSSLLKGHRVHDLQPIKTPLPPLTVSTKIENSFSSPITLPSSSLKKSRRHNKDSPSNGSLFAIPLFPNSINNAIGSSTYDDLKNNQKLHLPFPYSFEYNSKQSYTPLLNLPSTNYEHLKYHHQDDPLESAFTPSWGIPTSPTPPLLIQSNKLIPTPQKKETVWMMDNRFQHFTDVDDLIPPRPVKSKTPLPTIPTNEFAYTSLTGSQQPSFLNSAAIDGSPPETIPTGISQYRYGNTNGGYGSTGLSGSDREVTPLFPTHGYLIHNIQGNMKGEPPFYLIPASKEDVDNFHVQYFHVNRRQHVPH